MGFDGPQVVENVSFSVAPAETRILLGPAGVGKSVLLKLILGLLPPLEGSVELFGEDISHMPEEKLFPLRARAGMVFQEGALFDSLTVRDNVAYQLIQDAVPDVEIDARVHDALRFVGLEETFALFPSSLSGGMRRRVAIARALINKPQLILYDSPTGGLDPVASNTIIELIVKQRDVRATPSMLVTHRLQDAFTLCTHHFDSEQGCMVPLPEGQSTTTPPSSCSTKGIWSSTALSMSWFTPRMHSSASSWSSSCWLLIAPGFYNLIRDDQPLRPLQDRHRCLQFAHHGAYARGLPLCAGAGSERSA